MKYLLLCLVILVAGCCPKCPSQVYVFPQRTQEDMKRDLMIQQQVELQKEQVEEIKKVNEKKYRIY